MRNKSEKPKQHKWRRCARPSGIVEKFLVSDFMEYAEREYSKILSGLQTRAADSFRCPNCNQSLEDPPPHGQAVSHGCGVSYLAYGNSLQVWKTGN